MLAGLYLGVFIIEIINIIGISIIVDWMKIIGEIKEHINWFPGHMKKALRVIEENTHKIDVFL